LLPNSESALTPKKSASIPMEMRAHFAPLNKKIARDGAEQANQSQ
jgi:hypothetical protein